MDLEAVNPATGEKITAHVPDARREELEALAEERVSDTKLLAYLDRLELSADAKAVLASLLQTAVKAGEVIIKVGKKILEVAIYLATQFPNATFGLLLGLLVGAIVGAVPLIGAVLGPLATAIATTFGTYTGYQVDMQDKRIDAKIKEAAAMFQPLDADNDAR